ncbi:PREDICTED: saxitoxin and tetrodotoxin-binding protein 1-like [Cyprinodon variegatus]|uniref:Saxitoxin and tetrodotoxin-binding protein 1-like n=1 Tax=Cyprinodon variegatus TaxID=28743 RepID=A0A3Q2C963_CYPVA|nr:PREDICTED: saxitoxin and tetrodotoxin-binding protein 1-like [Cyprinodon variegatus]
MKPQATGALLLMMLLSCSAQSASEECNLPPKVQQQDVRKLGEVRWVVVKSFADYPAGLELMRNANSSIVQFKIKDDNESLLLTERNIVAGNCLVFHVNMTIQDPEKSNHTLILDGPGVQVFGGAVTPYDDKGRVDIHQGCPNCLLIVYHGVFEGTPGRILLFYRSEGKHLDAEELKAAESEQRRIAECLKFNFDGGFHYDGKADFCLEKKEENEA